MNMHKVEFGNALAKLKNKTKPPAFFQIFLKGYNLKAIVLGEPVAEDIKYVCRYAVTHIPN
jgi:hypothetical protein